MLESEPSVRTMAPITGLLPPPLIILGGGEPCRVERGREGGRDEIGDVSFPSDVECFAE